MPRAFFIDGPLAGEWMDIERPELVIPIPIPERVTWCGCDPGDFKEYENEPETVTYRAILRPVGPCNFLVMSKEDDPSAFERIFDAIVFRESSSLRKKKWIRDCRDRNAFE